MRPDVELCFCPYCGGESLWPVPDHADVTWECRDCLRVFALRLVSVGQPPQIAPSPITRGLPR